MRASIGAVDPPPVAKYAAASLAAGNPVLSYRHSFHAGNLADVLKHSILTAVLDAAVSKPNPLVYIDTHSGAGIYQFDDATAARAEHRAGTRPSTEVRPRVRQGKPFCTDGRTRRRQRVPRRQVEPGSIRIEPHECIASAVIRSGKVLAGDFAVDRRIAVHKVVLEDSSVARLGSRDLDAERRRHDGVLEHHHFARPVIVRLDARTFATRIEQQVAVQRDVALALEQRFRRIVEQQVAVNEIAVTRPRAGEREVPDQQARPCHLRRRSDPALHDHVAANHRMARLRTRGALRPAMLVLDLDTVASRVDDSVAFDQRIKEGVGAIGVAEVHAGARADDRIVAHDPPPRRALGRDTGILLARAVADDGEPLERHMMCPTPMALGANRIDAGASPVEHDIAHGHELRVEQAHRMSTGPTEEHRAARLRRSFDHNRMFAGAGKPVQRQAARVVSRRKLQGVAWPQIRQRAPVVIGGGEHPISRRFVARACTAGGARRQ